jgi:hypothetical protein
LLAGGTTPAALCAMTLGDVPPSPDLERLRARRREIGMPADDTAPLLIDAATGSPIESGDVRLHLGKARLTRVNIEANGSVCRGMLRNRYGVVGNEDEETS